MPIDTFNQETVKDQQLTLVVSLAASHTNSKLMNDQIAIMETMTHSSFCRLDYLVPASGFQSIQFKRLNIIAQRDFRIDFDKQSF